MWKEAIEKLKKLIKEHRTPEVCADNLLKARSYLRDPEDWKKFYSYITNPKGFDPDKTFETLGDLEKIPDIPPYEDCFEINEYRNGPLETKIHVRNKNFYKKTEDFDDDEKKEN